MSTDERIGCGDGGCVFGRPRGMHTNGGCRCLDKHDLQSVEGRQRLKRSISVLAGRLQAAEKAWAQYSHRHGEAREHTYGCESRHNKAAGAPCTCGLSALAAALERAP